MATQRQKLSIRFAHPAGYTFKEYYWLVISDLTSLDEARARGRTICTYRSKLLAGGYQITGASVTDSSRPRKARVPIDYDFLRIILDTESDGGICNNHETCLLYRFQATGGRFVVRSFRGIRDTWVANATRLVGADAYDPPTAINPAWPGLPAGAKGALTTPAIATTSTGAINAFMNVLAAYTQMYDERGFAVGSGVLRPWTAIYAEGVSTHDTGHSLSYGSGKRRKAKV